MPTSKDIQRETLIKNFLKNNYHLASMKKNKENDLLDELLMNPRNAQPIIKYNVELKNNINISGNNLLLSHGYNFMRLKNKNNIEMNQDINIQRPDKNVLKIDEVIKNEKIPQKYNFRKR